MRAEECPVTRGGVVAIGEGVGDAATRVCDVEASARAARERLRDLAPWTGGTRARAERLLSDFAALLDGPDCRLARTLRAQRRPWFVDDLPLRATLARAAGMIAQAGELCAVVERVRDLTRELERLRADAEPEVPAAWDRWFTRRGLTPESIDGALSADEVDVVRDRIAVGTRHLERWRYDLAQWLEDEGRRAAADQRGDALHPQLHSLSRAGLEARYELMLRLGEIQRGPVQRRAAAQLRETVRRHLGVVAASAGASVNDAPFRLVADSLATLTARELSAEEIAAYRECLALYGRRAAERGGE